MERIRYKYRKSKEGIGLRNIKCPVCGNPINWTKNVGSYNWNNKVILLAECWSGEILVEKPKHLFLIELDDLPMVEISNIKVKKKS